MTRQREALKMAINVLELYEERMNSSIAIEVIQACKDALEPKIELADTISVKDYQKLREQPVVKDSLTAQKQWQGLSDDELEELSSEEELMFWGFARAIEAKLKEKNT